MEFFTRDLRTYRYSHGKRAISVRATEGLLYVASRFFALSAVALILATHKRMCKAADCSMQWTEKEESDTEDLMI